jgi:uncharacterized protein YbjQ (UPF0145 family)
MSGFRVEHGMTNSGHRIKDQFVDITELIKIGKGRYSTCARSSVLSFLVRRADLSAESMADKNQKCRILRGILMNMPVTTTFTIEGYRIREYKGVIRGIIVRAPTIAQGIVGGLKSIIGGRIGAYTQMCEQARQQAYELMISHAQEVGANAVVGLRYDASEVVSKGSATEVLCYGTAVVIEPER